MCVFVCEIESLFHFVYALGSDLDLNVFFFRFMPVLFVLFANFCKNALCCSHDVCLCVRAHEIESLFYFLFML